MVEQEILNYTKRIVKRSGTSFYWGMRFLPREKREAMYALYAFCREVDDIADGVLSSEKKISLLDLWRHEIKRVFMGVPETLVGRALIIPVRSYELPMSVFYDVIDGMETDSAEVVRISDMKSLEVYCNRVACSVGRLSNPIFGIKGNKSEKLANSLGNALQITNILRDLYEDAKNNRLYIPGDLLVSNGINTECPMSVISDIKFPKICDIFLLKGKKFFSEASQIIEGLSSEVSRPPNLMLQNYSRVLDALGRRGWSNIEKRVSLPKSQKLWIILRYGLSISILNSVN